MRVQAQDINETQAAQSTSNESFNSETSAISSAGLHPLALPLQFLTRLHLTIKLLQTNPNQIPT